MKLTMYLFTRFCAIVAISLFGFFLTISDAAAQSVLNSGDIYSGASMSSRMNATQDSLILTLEVFYDCPTAVAFPGIVTLKSNCVFIDADLPLVLDEEISDVCPATFPICGLGGGVGERRVVYEGPVALAPFAACNPITFRIYPEQRTNTDNLANSATPSSDLMRVNMDLFLVNFASNATPVFGANGHPFVCSGSTTKFDPQVTETEGDSLVFSFSQPLTGAGALSSTPIPYAPGFSLADPMGNGITIDSETGILDFTSPASGHYQISIRVDEYDRATGLQKSRVFRDFQIHVDNACTNDGPVAVATITNVTNAALISNYEVTIDTGQAASFDFAFTGTAGETVSLQTTATSFLGGSSTSVSTAGTTTTMTINWTPTGADVGTHFITISAEDNACDISGKGAQKIRVNVQESAVPVSITSVDVVHETCAGLEDGQITINRAGGTGPFGFYLVFFNGVSLDTITQTNNVFTNLEATNYDAHVVDSNDLTKDSVTSVVVIQGTNFISAGFNSILAACDTVCNGRARALTFGGTNPRTYLWDDGSTVGPTNSALCGGVRTVTVTEAGGCQVVDQVVIPDGPAIFATVDSTFDATCNGGNDGQAYFSPHGGYGPSTSTAGYIIDQTEGTFEPYDTSFAGGTSVALGDDQVSPVLPIGFSFEFFGNTYTNFRISSNGFITFSGSAANGCCSGQNIPAAGLPNDLIAAYWEDLNPAVGGEIEFYTIGAGANRALVVNFIEVPHFGSANEVTFQIVLHETSNIIEIFGSNLPSDGGNHTQGIENSTGTIAFAAPGRTAANWSATNDYIAFIPETQNFTLSWSAIGSGTSATNLTAGNYTVTISDARSCSDTVQFTIAEPTPIVIDTVLTQPSCAGDADGSITASASGSNGGPFTFLWSTGATTPTITNLTAGVYSVTATDASGCTNNISITLTDPAAVVASINLDSDVSCFLGSDGQLTANGAGGSPGYTFLWSTGSTNQTISSLIAGNYTVTVTDVNGCDDVASQAVAQPLSAVSVTASSTDVSCIGGNDGTATANNATGGTPGYTYLWTTGATTQSINGLIAGSYTVTATDANGCTDDETVVIDQPATGLAATVTTTGVSCFGLSDGTATASLTGGTAPLTFAWSNGGTTANITGLAGGVYDVTVTDANGCSGTGSGTVNSPTSIPLVFTNTTQISCFGATDGSISAIGFPGSGTPPYTFLWSTGATTSSITGLGVGIYTVTLTDANGCTDTETENMTAPTAISLTFNSTNTSCAGVNNGGASVTPTGGTSPYTFSWSTGATIDTISNLAAGTYLVTVTDNNSCQAIDSVVITDGVGVVASVSVFDPTCAGESSGSAIGGVVGGTGTLPFSYAWSTGATFQFLNGIPAGTYTLTVTDGAGCQDDTTFTLVDPTALNVSIIDSINPTCANNDGSTEALATGGTGVLSYAWSNGGTSALITALPAGTYIVTTTDGNGCTDSASVILDAAPTLTATGVLITNESCVTNDGSASVTVVGGTAPLTFAWTGGGTTQTISNLDAGTYIATVTDVNNCSDTAQVIVADSCSCNWTASGVLVNDVLCNGDNTGTATVSNTGATAPITYAWSNGSTNDSLVNVPAGTYTVTLTDANGCTDTASVVIDEPTVLSATVYSPPVIPGFTYIGENGNEFIYYHAASQTWTAARATALAAGGDLIVISDATDQAYYSSVLPGNSWIGLTDEVVEGTYVWVDGTVATYFNWNAGEPNNFGGDEDYIEFVGASYFWNDLAAFQVRPFGMVLDKSSLNLTNVTCNGGNDGSAVITGAGGTLPYTYAWSNGQTTDTIAGLVAGTYIGTITDANGCSAVDTAIITEPDTLVFGGFTGITNPGCDDACDGAASATISGGTSPITFAWSSGSTAASATGLCGGGHTVTMTDANGCQIVETLALVEPPSIYAVVDSTDSASCNGVADGAAFLSAYGGTVAPTSTAEYVIDQTEGEYEPYPQGRPWNAHNYKSITLDDDATSDTINIFGGANFSFFGVNHTHFIMNSQGFITFDLSNPNSGQVNGQFSVPTAIPSAAPNTPRDFIAAYWDDLDPSTGVTTLETYLIGTAPNRVRVVNYIDIDHFAAPSPNILSTFQIVLYETSNIIQIHSEALNPNGSPLVQGIENFAGTEAYAVPGRNLTNFSATNDYVAFIPTTQNFTYTWSSVGSGASSSVLPAGNYTVTAADGTCSDVVNFTIGEPAPVLASIVSSAAPTCFGGNDGQATVAPSGGDAPYTFLWTSGETTAAAVGLSAGLNTVTVTDANGCTVTASTTLPNGAAINVGIASTNSFCFVCTGTATATVTGALAPFTYSWSNGVVNSVATTTNQLTALCSGPYGITVTDANGCVDSNAVNVSDNFVPNVTITATAASCANTCDGTADANYTCFFGCQPYRWYSGLDTTNLIGTGDLITGLCPGTYLGRLTTNFGCDGYDTIIINAPSPLNLVMDSTDAACGVANGVASVTVSGGAPAYTYAWSNGGTTDTISNLNAGTYIVTVTDNNGCTDTAQVTVNAPSNLVASISNPINALCDGSSDGSALAQGTNGTAPYTFVWDNGETNALAIALDSGIHCVTVTDALGCTDTACVSISDPDAITFTFTETPISCVGPGNDGAIIVASIGGTGAHTYLWNTGSTGNSITGLTTGTYSVTATDANGCQNNASYFLNPPGNFTVAIVDSTDIDCNGNTNGEAEVQVITGGSGAYSFAWDNGSTTAIVSNLTAGLHTVTVTDLTTLCVDSASVTIDEPTLLVATITGSVDNLCFNGTDGSATGAGSGGTAPYTLTWSNGDVGATADSLPAGMVILTVTDANGCIATDNIMINQPATGLSASLVVNSQPSCTGDSASITASGAGGSGTYTFLWPNGQTTATVLLPAGSYCVTVSDGGVCEDTACVTIVDPLPVTATTAVALPTCPNGNDGSVTLTGAGGDGGPYTFLWDDASTNATRTNLSAGTYAYTVTDASGCSGNSTVNVVNPAAMTASFSGTTVSACGTCNGTATVTITNGTAPYTFAWASGSTTANGTSLCAGTNAVTVTDFNGCVDTFFVNIGSLGADTVFAAVVTDATCNGGNDGSALATYNCNVAPCTIAWIDSASGAVVSNLDLATGLSAGTYYAQLTNDSGCVSLDTISITEPTAVVASTVFISNVSCPGGADGSASVSATGGTPGYTVLWDNGETTTTAISLSAGVHCVTVTDALGCTDTACVIIDEPANGVSVNAFAINTLLCNGDNNGSVAAAATGGTAPYSFIWNGVFVTDTLNSLSAGSYIVEVTDAGGCTALDTVILTDPAAITGVFSGVTNPLCAGDANGSATITGGGGTGPYTYLWASGNTAQTETGLPAGNHCVDITDANGCIEQFCILLVDPAPITNTFSGITNSSCIVCDGTATANPLPAAGAPYSFAWDNGQTTATNNALCAGLNQVTITDANGCTLVANAAINANGADLVTADSVDASCGNCDGQVFASYTCTSPLCTIEWTDLGTGLVIGTTDTISNLCAGTYSVELTNGAGCISSDIVSVNVPDLIDPNETITDASCFGACDGSIALAPTGGSGVFTFAWSNGSTSATNAGLCAGSYTVTISDGAGCDSIATFVIDQPTEIVLASTISDASCNGVCDGSISITASGGAGNYSFNWSPVPGNGNGLSLASGLCAGTYFLTVTDINGCTTLDTFTITEPAAIVQTAVIVNDATCGVCDGSIIPTIAGGAGGFTYAWSTGAASDTLGSLCLGFYDLTVTDASGCFEVFGYPVSEINGPGILLTSTNTSASGVCDGTATVNSLVTPLTYLWSDGQTTQTASNLCAGFYIVTVTDGSGCSTIDTITITEPDVLDVTFDVIEISCAGNGCDGEIDAVATGGVPPYNFAWSNGATASLITGLCSGTYVLTLTDDNGATIIDSVELADPQPFTITSVVNDVTCPGECDGNIAINVAGGNPPYSILWNTGDTTLAITDLCGGTYSVTITDTAGCSDSLEFVIDDPAPIVGNLISQVNPDCQVNNGSITVSAAGGNGGPYTYEWLDAFGTPLIPAQTDSVATNLFAGIYALKIVDANGCTDTSGFILNNANAPVIDLDLLVDVSCFGECDGEINTTISGGTAPYTILWSNGDTTDDIDSLCAGNDTIAVLDANLCASFDIYTISEPTEINLQSVEITDVTCGADCDGTIDVSITGGTTPYSFAWSNGETDSTIAGLCAGAYTLTVTDANGCTFITTQTAGGPSPMVITLDSINNATCTNTGDGEVQITVTGGTAPYTYNWISDSVSILTASDLTGVIAGDYTLIVTDASGCIITDSFTIDTEFFVDVTVMDDFEVCPFSNEITVTGTNSGASSARWLRSNGVVIGSGNSTVVNTTEQTTTIIYEGINNVCVARDTLRISWTPGPGVDAGPDKTIEPGGITSIGGAPTANSGVDVVWTPARDLTSVTEYNPQANPLETITYYVSATDADGCFGVDSMTVTVEDLVDPVGGFSPNGDGVNEFFLIDRIDRYPNAIVQIFNRWGNLIYESSAGYTNPWNGKHNGKELTVGTYYYVIDLKDDQVKNLITGPVTILK